MKRSIKPLWRALLFALCGVVLFTALFALLLRQAQAAVLSAAPSEQPAAYQPQTVEKVLAEDVSPLTGLPYTDDVTRGLRVTAISVDNLLGSRPQSGLSEAQMLMEVTIDGYLTRYLALYDDYNTMPTVGPLRSARKQHFELVLPYQPIFVSNGSNVFLNQMLDVYDYNEWHVNENEPSRFEGIFYRDVQRLEAGFPSERTVYTNGGRLADAFAAEELDVYRTYNSGYWQFVPYDIAPRELENPRGESLTVYFTYNVFGSEIETGNFTSFTYNSQRGQYMMAQNDSEGERVPTIDAGNGEQLAFDNVLVLFTDIRRLDEQESAASMEVSYTAGFGMYFCGGRYEMFRWGKGGPLETLKLYNIDVNETPLTVNPGTSYIAVADIELAADFTFGAIGDENNL